MRVRIDIACNNPDNGVFAHRAEQIQLPDDLGEFMAHGFYENRAPRLVEMDGAIRLAGKRWPITGSKEWVGNWCWNAYWLELSVAADFVVWLHRRKLYSIDQGESRLFEMWRKTTLFDAQDRAFIERLLAKASLHQRNAA